ncbi:UPF0415 protein C7orf25 homolog [Clavelina lepadiformis]|uniref:UPF0415 protein C7orf25 homolog n=1 Tax=Clavelina lepadiformis TaxID=159417 RepID=UPI004042FF68
MSMDFFDKEASNIICTKVEKADKLLSRMEKIESSQQGGIPGSYKLINKIKSEKKFLEKLQDDPTMIKQSNLSSSNLSSLTAILDCLDAISSSNVVGLVQRFTDDKTQSICVDIVACKGHVWVKVIAKRPKALFASCKGQGQFGERTLMDIANDYIAMAKQHPVNYQIPQIVFHFANGVPGQLVVELNKLGILVDGCVDGSFQDSDDSSNDESSCNVQPNIIDISIFINNFTHLSIDKATMSSCMEIGEKKLRVIKKVNLDVTTLLSLVSNLCNGHCQYFYGVPVLDEQAEQERKEPVLPKLKEFLKDKEMLVCETALHSFEEIISTIGGVREKERSKQLLEKVKVVPDNPSQRTLNLTSSAKLNTRAKVIFGTGDQEEAITVTANTGFVRAATQHGVSYSVYQHEARALTEAKESDARVAN